MGMYTAHTITNNPSSAVNNQPVLSFQGGFIFPQQENSEYYLRYLSIQRRM
jgi:hypothetical protein